MARPAADASPDDVIVVGAGPAGLAASACLQHEGIAHRVLEREASVGAAWRRHYDRLHLHTTKAGSALPMMPWPRSVPQYPSRDDVVRYLEGYASSHRVEPRFGVTVQAVRRVGERFALQTDAGTLTPRAVVMATGCNAVPRWPALPGLATFGGPVIHASAYRHPAVFRGCRTLVVGCGNSGAEIALDLAEHAVEVALVVRGPVHVVPRDLFGRPTQHTSILLSHLPLAWRDAVAGAAVHWAVGDLSRWGIERPPLGPNRMIEETGRVPIVDVGTLAMIRQGAIRVLPAVEEVLAHGVRVADGRVLAFDAMVLATGYDTGLGGLIDGFDSIARAGGRPKLHDGACAIPGLYFVGFGNMATGAFREIAREAPRVARQLGRDLLERARCGPGGGAGATPA